MDPWSIISFIILLVLLIFFAWTEIPLMSVAQHTIESALKKWRMWARALKKIKERNESLLIVNLIGTTVVTIWISSLGTVVSIEMAKELWLSAEKWAWIAVLVVSWIVLLIWEIAPKILWVRYSESVAFFVAPIYRFLMIIMRPIIFLTDIFVKILNLFLSWKTSLHDKKMSIEEFEAFIDMSHEKWAVEEEEHKKIKWVLDLGDTLAESVMTPRVQMDAVNENITIDSLCEYLMMHSHSRIPVYKETIDHIDSFITFKQAFKLKEAGRWKKKLFEIQLDEIIKIPLTQPIDIVFKNLQKSRKHIALVLDEHWWVEWIITIEDIVEEVFWDIKDETDKEDVYLSKMKDGKILANWNVIIEDILEELKISEINDIWLEEEFCWENLSYIITSKLERFPINWEKIDFVWKHKTLQIEVKQINNWKIWQVIVEKIKNPTFKI